MPDTDQSYGKDSVNLWVDPGRKESWEQYLEEESEFQYLSQLIRHAVEQEIWEGETLDLSEDVVSQFEELRDGIEEVGTRIQELESRLSGLERQLRTDPQARQLANEVYEILPTRGDINDYQSQELTGCTRPDAVVTSVDSGRVEAFAERLDVEPPDVRRALDRLQEETHQVHVMDAGSEPRYYKEA